MAERISITGPKPLKVDRSAYSAMPKEIQDQYVRTLSGDFELDYIHSDDVASNEEYLTLIANGEGPRVLPAGWTSETEKANAEVQAAQTQKVVDEVARLQAEDTARRKAVMEARLAKMNAEMRTRYGFGDASLPPTERR